MHLAHCGNQSIHLPQRLVDHLPYRAQGLCSRDKRLDSMQLERTFGKGVGTTHGVVVFISGQKKVSSKISIPSENRQNFVASYVSGWLGGVS